MGQFTFTVTNELIKVMPELTEHNYKEGDVISVLGQTYSPCSLSDPPPAVEYDNIPLAASPADDGPGGSDPTKPRGKYP